MSSGHITYGPRVAGRVAVALAVVVVMVVLVALLAPGRAGAAPEPIPVPQPPSVPSLPDGDRVPTPDTEPPQQPAPFGDDEEDDGSSATIGLAVPDVTGDSSNVVVIILLLSVLSIAPSLLILMTSFTRIVIVMSLTRNAIGIPQLPPQQVIVGLSLFLTLFVMAPTLEIMNEVALQPLLNGEVSFTEAGEAATTPLREFMLQSTRESELKMFLDASETATPVTRDAVPLTALIPAFVLSELKSAFILGFIIFVPFMVIDIVVSAAASSSRARSGPPRRRCRSP